MRNSNNLSENLQKPEIYQCGSKSVTNYGFSSPAKNYSTAPAYNNFAPRSNYNNKSNSINLNSQRYLGNSPNRNEHYEQQIFQKSTAGVNFDNYDLIPVSIKGNSVLPPLNTFSEIDYGDILNLNIKLSNFSKPTPIQKHAIPNLMAQRDLMACAQTGSGKTAAYLLPIIHKLHKEFSNNTFDRPISSEPYALVLLPTRELALQVETDFRRLSYRTSLKGCVAYGGASATTQIHSIQRGCDFLFATPGRLNDLLRRGILKLSKVEYFVLDEADRMLDMGFESQIKSIIDNSHIPNKLARQSLMFSATFPPRIQNMAEKYLNNYINLSIGRVGAISDNISQKFVNVTEQSKTEKLLQDIKEIRSDKPDAQILVFVDRKIVVDQIEIECYRAKHKVVSIHGDREQNEREIALGLFKKKDAYVMIATDVAQRGLDIPSISHVINYSFPNDIEDYVHRIGRTGRAGNTGTAISYLNEEDSQTMRQLIEHLKENKQEIPDFIYDLIKRGYVKKQFTRQGNKDRGNRRFGGFRR